MVGVWILLFSGPMACWFAVHGPPPGVVVMTLAALFGGLMLLGARTRPPPRGVVVRVSPASIEYVAHPPVPGAAPIRRAWPWSALVSAELVDLVFEPVPGRGGGHREGRVVEAVFADGQRLRLDLEWRDAARVGGSLLSKRFDPAAAVTPETPASRTIVRGPE